MSQRCACVHAWLCGCVTKTMNFALHCKFLCRCGPCSAMALAKKVPAKWISVLFLLHWNASNHPEGTEQLFVSVERQNVGWGGGRTNFVHSVCSCGYSVCTIDPVVFRDVCADVVLVRRRAKRACECCVFAQEVWRRAGIEVLIWNESRSGIYMNYCDPIQQLGLIQGEKYQETLVLKSKLKDTIVQQESSTLQQVDQISGTFLCGPSNIY